MKITIYIKLAVLILFLIVIVLARQELSGSKIGAFLNALGVPVAADSNAQPKEYLSMNLCKSRIEKMLLSEEERIEEIELKWLAFGPDKRELDYIAMEKWLGRHCRLHVEEVAPQEAKFEPFMGIVFVNGKEFPLLRSGMDLFQFDGVTFKSEQLLEALKELYALTELKSLEPAGEAEL